MAVKMERNLLQTSFPTVDPGNSCGLVVDLCMNYMVTVMIIFIGTV